MFCRTRFALSLSLSLSISAALLSLSQQLVSPPALHAHHQTSGTTTTITTGRRVQLPATTGRGNGPGRALTPRPKGKPTTIQATALSSNIGASVNGFSIQSFNADLYTGSAGAEVPIMVPPGAGGVAPKIVLRYSSGVVDEMTDLEDPNSLKDQASWVGLGWTLHTGGYCCALLKAPPAKPTTTSS